MFDVVGAGGPPDAAVGPPPEGAPSSPGDPFDALEPFDALAPFDELAPFDDFDSLPVGPFPAWSRFGPDGLLATVLAEQDDGSCAERVERVGGWERVIAWAQAAQLREIAGLARAAEDDPAFGDDPEQVYASVCAEVGLMARVAARTARARVDDAVALAERLPATMAALSAGEISLSSARAIAEETLGLDASLLPAAERQVLARAAERTTGQIRAQAKRVVARLDAEALRRRAEQARRQRAVTLLPEPDGMATLSAYLPAHQAVAAFGAVDAFARQTGGAGDERPLDARRADALVDLLLGQFASDEPGPRPAGDAVRADAETESGHAAGSGQATERSDMSPADSDESSADPGPVAAPDGVARSGRRGGVQVRVGVTVGLTTLLGLDQFPGELAGYGPIPAEMARELAAEGTWRRLLTDPVTGALLDYGTTRYRPPPSLTAHVIARDQTCTFPSCRVPANRCDVDHRIPFDADAGVGDTSEANLAALCRTHHRLKQQPGWNVSVRPDGSLSWRTPTDHVYLRRPLPMGAALEPGEIGDSGAFSEIGQVGELYE
jgi:hypothetical protein